jgi:hypothetical protein
VLEKLKSAYKLWHEYHEKLPKTQKYSLGNRIDKLCIENIEATATAAFLPKVEKIPWVNLAIRKTDTIKILLAILWETRSLDDKKYIALSEILNEVGKMLGGWNGQLAKSFDQTREKQNSPAKAGEK